MYNRRIYGRKFSFTATRSKLSVITSGISGITIGFQLNISGSPVVLPVEISGKIWCYYQWFPLVYQWYTSDFHWYISGIPAVKLGGITSGIPVFPVVLPMVYQWYTTGNQ